MPYDYASYYQNEQMRQLADDLAKQEYQRALAQTGSEGQALKAAQFAWQQKMDEAGLTGMYQGQYTMPTQQSFAQMFGTWGTPTAGQQTLAGSEQGFTQGLRTQQEQRAAQAQQQAQAQQYLSLLASLRGPADWAKYQQVLGSTPGGMRDLYAAAMGQYVPGGGATTGVQPQAVSLQSLMGQVSGNPYAYTGQGGGQLNTPNVYGQNTTGIYQQQGTQPNVSAFTPQGSIPAPPAPAPGAVTSSQYSPTATGSVINQSTWGGASQAQNAQGNGTNTMGAQPNQMNLPAPNQVAAQSWKNLTPSQQEMMKGDWEAQGWYKPDVEALMNQALPKYANNAATAGTWRMRS